MPRYRADIADVEFDECRVVEGGVHEQADATARDVLRFPFELTVLGSPPARARETQTGYGGAPRRLRGLSSGCSGRPSGGFS